MSDPFEPVRAETPRQRLIEAAIAEIEARGLSQLTVRAVAARAEMNVAAVNYHFRSKQALVAAALDGTIQHMLADTHTFLARLPSDPRAVFTELLGYYLEGSLRYPHVCKAHLHDASIADDYTGPFPRAFAPVLEKLRSALLEALPGCDPRLAARRIVAALSAVFFPAFFAELYGDFAAFERPDERARYVAELARQLLGPVEPGPGPRKISKPRARR